MLGRILKWALKCTGVGDGERPRMAWGRQLEWIQASDHVWDNSGICREAAAGEQLSVLQWVRANSFYCDSRTCINAATGGHLSIV